MRLFAHGDFGSSATSHFHKWLADDKHREEKDEAMEQLWDETAFTSANINQSRLTMLTPDCVSMLVSVDLTKKRSVCLPTPTVAASRRCAGCGSGSRQQ